MIMEITGIDNCYGDYDINYRECECEYVEGNVTKPIKIDKKTKECEIRTDIVVKKIRSIRLWGQVRDCKGNPIECALVKLVREVKHDCKTQYVGVAHGVTDCMGFYQFDICVPKDYETKKYRVFVSKQATGKEIVIKKTECNPCRDKCHCEE